MIGFYPITKFLYGIIDSVDERKIPPGASSRSINFVTTGNRQELRRGYHLLGDTVQTGTGIILGLHVTFKADGTAIVYRKRGLKLEYLDTSLTPDDWAEVGTNLFPTAALNDEVAFANYASTAGAMMFFSSPNSGLYKIMTANPASYTDLTDSTKNFKGYIKIKQNRMFLWGRTADKSGLYGSYVDTLTNTTVTGEATVSLGGTLAFKAAGVTRTCYGVVITLTGTGEVYTDNYNGILTGSLGGTGTINYTSGVYTLTNAGVGTATYQWENSNNHGVGDFSKSATRLAGEGFVFRQDDGGSLLNALSYGDSEYCYHETKTWVLTLTATDTAATNLIYRDKVGIPNWRAAVETGKGIYYLDYTDKTDPQVRKLALEPLGSNVIPSSISKGKKLNGELVGIDLEDYRFDKAAMTKQGDTILLAFRHKDSTVNNRVLVYNEINGAIDVHDYYVSVFTNYNGVLLGGDTLTNNVYELFSGLDDDDSAVSGEWEMGLSDLEIKQLKKSKRLVIEGNIGPNQQVKLYAAVDNGAYVEIADGSASAFIGTGSYVDTSTKIYVGATTVGSKEVGGGSTGIDAYHYEQELHLGLDKFERIKLKFTIVGLGWFDFNKIEFRKLFVKSLKVPNKYR